MKLYNRNSIFYIVINIPKKLKPRIGVSQIWKSLGTKNKAIAKLRAEMMKMTINRKILSETIKLESEEDLDWLDDDDDDNLSLEEISKICKEKAGTTTIRRKKLSIEEKRQKLPSQKDYTELEAEKLAYYWLVTKLEKEKKNLNNLNNPLEERKYYQELLSANKYKYENWEYQIIENDMNIFLYDELEPKPSKDSKNYMLNAFMRANIQFLEYVVSYLHGYRGELRDGLIDNINNHNDVAKSNVQSQNALKPTSKIMSLVDLVELYNEDISRQNTSIEQKERIKNRVVVVDEIIGIGKPINQISTEDCDMFVRELHYLPHRFGMRAETKNLTVRQAIEKVKRKPTIQKLSQKTINEYIQTISSVLKFAMKKQYINLNPMDSVSLPKADKKREKSNKYLSFSIHQLQTMFNMPTYTGCLNEKLGWNNSGSKIFRNTKFWVPLIALFTGARLNEICQLLTDDIKQIDGVDVFSISLDNDNTKKVKSVSAIRNVPIHPELKKIGFMKFVEDAKKQKQKRLFIDLKIDTRGRYSSDFSKHFSKFLDAVNKNITTDSEKLQKGHVFHSFRHSMRSELRNNLAADSVAIAIGGWDAGENLSHHYGEGISMPVLLKEISEKLIYEGLNLNHLYV